MRIGELSKRTSVSTRLLRYYEKQGLLVSARRSNGYREFDDDAPMIVAQIRGLLDAGLPTEVIREVLPCAEGKAPRLNNCPELSAVLHEVLQNIETRMDKLSHHRDALLTYLDSPSTTAPEETRAVKSSTVPTMASGASSETR
ncbi:MerR family transcriptional regulator [Amycolatopsis sp. YIM 10]|uniref:MerR family transcriptional regulator n=1 Tax=Amycolatopsis sp. YIM 10 TaxID=2653857 RepID=UPI0012906FD0|nr:MerR family transcriptional regulator [Amycolatopsis sp. YIM 10]QFU88465.1 HTH-type transcriptional regulator ZntR [Amycolatopsis sp. YIM 10]